MRLGSPSFFRLCLAGSALGTVGMFSPANAATFRPTYTQADAIATAAPSQSVTFNVYLPLRNQDKLTALLARQQTVGSADYHKWLTPAQFGAQFGPAQGTMDAVRNELVAAGFSVTAQARALKVTGTAAMVSRAFGAQLTMVRGADNAVHTVAMSGLKMSPTMVSAGAQIIAFANRRYVMHTHSQRVDGVNPENRYGPTGAYWFTDLKQAYGYPASNAMVSVNGTQTPLDGTGVTIAALMSSDILDTDIKAQFRHEKYAARATGPLPVVTHEYLAGAVPGVLTGAFDEASLDTQQETGGAPGATTILYDIPDLSDQSISQGYAAIDEINEADVVSSSFGECESFYQPAYNGGVDYSYIPALYHQLFAQGNAQGITFLVSSGDESGKECPSLPYVYGGPTAHFTAGASSPAVDPNVTAVGGTNLVTVAANTLNSAYKKENAYVDPLNPIDPYGLGVPVYGGFWGAGGGPSVMFAKPDYQSSVHTVSTMRSTPDVGMQVGGCPGGGEAILPCDGGKKAINGNGNSERSAVAVYIEGNAYGFIGTSVASPEFASALALMVELHGRQGNVNPYLYALSAQQAAGTLASPAFHVDIPGWNGVHPNSYPDPTFNYTVGLGTPYVASLIGAPAGTPLAGAPQSPSNP
jgi:subtilase family serine protease